MSRWLWMTVLSLGCLDSHVVRDASPRAPGAAGRDVARLLARAGPGRWFLNGCTPEATGLPYDSLRRLPLNASTLETDPEISARMCSEDVQYAMGYLFSCAYGQGESLTVRTPDGKMVSFEGGLGLAPEWKTGPCDTACQERVSSCLIAFRNFYPVHVLVDLNLDDRPFVTDGGGESVTRVVPLDVEEGAFYGNVFVGVGRSYACRGASYDPFVALVRRCALPFNDCVDIQAVGPCSEVDGYHQRLTASVACEGRGPAGGYRRCHNLLSLEDGGFPPGSVTYEHPVTIKVHRSNPNPDCQ